MRFVGYSAETRREGVCMWWNGCPFFNVDAKNAHFGICARITHASRIRFMIFQRNPRRFFISFPSNVELLREVKNWKKGFVRMHDGKKNTKWPKPCRCVILTQTHFQNQKSILIKLSTQNVQNIVTDYSCARILFKTTSAATILKKISKNWKTWTTKTQKNGAKIDIPSSSRYSFAWFFRQWW